MRSSKLRAHCRRMDSDAEPKRKDVGSGSFRDPRVESESLTQSFHGASWVDFEFEEDLVGTQGVRFVFRTECYEQRCWTNGSVFFLTFYAAIVQLCLILPAECLSRYEYGCTMREPIPLTAGTPIHTLPHGTQDIGYRRLPGPRLKNIFIHFRFPFPSSAPPILVLHIERYFPNMHRAHKWSFPHMDYDCMWVWGLVLG
jgi:hypothetical protein